MPFSAEHWDTTTTTLEWLCALSSSTTREWWRWTYLWAHTGGTSMSCTGFSRGCPRTSVACAYYHHSAFIHFNLSLHCTAVVGSLCVHPNGRWHSLSNSQMRWDWHKYILIVCVCTIYDTAIWKQVKEYIRRAKAWRNRMWANGGEGKPSSYLMSLLVLEAYETKGRKT